MMHLTDEKLNCSTLSARLPRTYCHFDLDATNKLGLLYLIGSSATPRKTGIDPEMDLKARQQFETAAQKGDPSGKWNLAWMYENGRGGEKDEIKAFALYQSVTGTSVADTANRIGDYYRGNFQRSDTTVQPRGKSEPEALSADRKAFVWYERASAGGNIQAYMNLGKMYENGWGVGKDVRKAQEAYNTGIRLSGGDTTPLAQDCNRLAGRPLAMSLPRNVAGVLFDDIVTDKAIIACTAASVAFPLELRFKTWTARAYDKAEQYDKAHSIYKEALASCHKA